VRPATIGGHIYAARINCPRVAFAGLLAATVTILAVMIPLGIFAQGPSEIVSPAAEIIGLPSALSTGQPFGNAKSIAPEKPRGGRISAPESWAAGIRQTLELRLADALVERRLVRGVRTDTRFAGEETMVHLRVAQRFAR
jgi:hypothetical protein